MRSQNSEGGMVFWRAAGLFVFFHFSFGLIILAEALLGADGPLLTRGAGGLGVIDRILVFSVFDAWVVHTLLLALDLAAIGMLYTLGAPRRAGRFIDSYVSVAVLITISHACAILLALRVGVFNTPGATFAVNTPAVFWTSLATNAVLISPAGLFLVGRLRYLP